MPNYIVNKNKQPSGDNEVHVFPKPSNCLNHNYPAPHNREALGYHSSCRGAVTEAKRRGYNADGCYWCANECHTR